MSFQSINSSKPKEELFMRISKLFETVHTDFNVSAHIAKVVDTQIAKYKNIKNILKKIIKKATIILSIIVMNTFTFIGPSGAVNVKKIEISVDIL
jgi:hypothetical protein